MHQYYLTYCFIHTRIRLITVKIHYLPNLALTALFSELKIMFKIKSYTTLHEQKYFRKFTNIFKKIRL